MICLLTITIPAVAARASRREYLSFFYISQMYEFLHSQGQTRSFGDVGSMSGLPGSGHGWAIYEPAVGERAERPYKKEPRSSRG